MRIYFILFSKTIFLFFLTVTFHKISLAGETMATITITANQAMAPNTPVFLPLENKLLSFMAAGNFHLERITETGRAMMAAQLVQTASPQLCWLLPEKMTSGEKQLYELVSGTDTPKSLVHIGMDSEALEVHYHNQKVLRYQYALMPAPAGEQTYYERSGFIHPIWSPRGTALTRIHPSDHLHHLGFWNPWTKTEFEGRPVDFWNLKEQQGTVRFVNFKTLMSGEVFGGFEAEHQFVVFDSVAGEKIALNEIWQIRCYAQTQGNTKFWLWDFTTCQSCASESPLKILQYRYGGFGFRGTADWNETNSDYVTSEGKTRKDGNGTRARWCNISGKTDHGEAGILFISHPDNHEYPEPLRIWPQGEVFFGFCPVVYADWEIKPGENYVRKYRVIVYDGKISRDEAELFWSNFVSQPTINVQWHSN